MNTSYASNARFRAAQRVLKYLGTILLLVNLTAHGKPRPPLPPFPEGQLAQWRFNATNGIEGNIFSAQGYTLVEGWSGYALQMSGASPRTLLISTVRTNGRPNVAAGSGTIRFWFAPYWASKSSGGAGPGAWAQLLEIGRPDGSGFWLSLAADPDGNRLKVSTRVAGVPTALVDAPIQWPSNQWHQAALVYGTNGVQVVIDGNVIGLTPVSPIWPSANQWPAYL